MIKLVALDSGPVGLLTHPKPSQTAEACRFWLESLLEQNTRVLLPAICDYELRREYYRRGTMRALQKLDELHQVVETLPINDLVLRRAAEVWAQAWRSGIPSASPKALDVDCILIAQVRFAVERAALMENEWIIATTDLGDLKRHAPAARWQDIA